MLQFLIMAVLFLLVAGSILYKKYRIVIGGTRAIGVICDKKSIIASRVQKWCLAYLYTVEVNGYKFPVQSEIVYFKQYAKGDKCVVYYKDGQRKLAVLAYHFSSELIATLAILFAIAFFKVSIS